MFECFSLLKKYCVWIRILKIRLRIGLYKPKITSLSILIFLSYLNVFFYDKNGHRCIVEKKRNGEKNSILKSAHAHGNGKSYFCINRNRKTFETEMNLHHIANDSMNSISGRWWNLFPLKIQLNCYWFFILSPSIEKKLKWET